MCLKISYFDDLVWRIRDRIIGWGTACFPLVESLRFFPNVLSSMSLYSMSTCYGYLVHVENIYPFFKGCFCLLLWILIVVGDLLVVFWFKREVSASSLFMTWLLAFNLSFCGFFGIKNI